MSEADILVVEDAPEFVQIVSTVLRSAGHRVRIAGTVADARAAMDTMTPDVVVLDLSLPDGDGLDLCRHIRDRSTSYILVLTGRDDEVDKLLGFRLGADDYVTKPFSARELAARVDALMRRPRGGMGGSAERTFANMVVRPGAREVLVDGEPIELTRIEFDLIDALTSSPKMVFSRAQLLDRVWGPGWYGVDHVVDVHVANLRKKIDGPGERSKIRTVRGVGYGMAH